MIKKSNEYYMSKALKEAAKAFNKEEVPVGAVIVKDDKIIANGYNQNILLNDPTAHAEIQALKKASRKFKNYRLPNGCKLYVTIEPCAMCAGALIWARVSEIIFGAYDIKAGACGSALDVPGNKKLNHKIKITGGVMENECRSIIQTFFKNRR